MPSESPDDVQTGGIADDQWGWHRLADVDLRLRDLRSHRVEPTDLSTLFASKDSNRLTDSLTYVLTCLLISLLLTYVFTYLLTYLLTKFQLTFYLDFF